MVIEICRNVVYVSGAMRINQWPAIKTSALLACEDRSQKVTLDFARLTFLTEAGEMTFLDAIYDIEWLALPISMVNLPAAIQVRLETLVPGCLALRLTDAMEARRIQQAISSEAWWERLWGSI